MIVPISLFGKSHWGAGPELALPPPQAMYDLLMHYAL